MKASKVHKRLSRVEGLISDLTERYSKGALHVHAALEGAKVAIAHLRETVNSQNSPKTAKKSAVETTEKSKSIKRKIGATHKGTSEGGARQVSKKAAAAKAVVTKKKRVSAVKKTPKQAAADITSAKTQ